MSPPRLYPGWVNIGWKRWVRIRWKSTFNGIAQKVGYASTAEPIIEELLALTPAVMAEVQAELPQDFSPRVRDAILGGLEQAARTLGEMPP